MGARVTTPMFNFGLWVTKNTDTVYYAESPGFVCAYGTEPNNNIYGLTDSSNPPTTYYLEDGIASSHCGNITMPVRKGDYWKVIKATSVYWISVISQENVK